MHGSDLTGEADREVSGNIFLIAFDVEDIPGWDIPPPAERSPSLKAFVVMEKFVKEATYKACPSE